MLLSYSISIGPRLSFIVYGSCFIITITVHLYFNFNASMWLVKYCCCLWESKNKLRYKLKLWTSHLTNKLLERVENNFHQTENSDLLIGSITPKLSVVVTCLLIVNIIMTIWKERFLSFMRSKWSSVVTWECSANVKSDGGKWKEEKQIMNHDSQYHQWKNDF